MTVSVKRDDDLKGRARQLAQARRRSPHWLVHEAIRQYVEREEARESFRLEAQDSWAAAGLGRCRRFLAMPHPRFAPLARRVLSVRHGILG